jgi:alpha-2-macroglobulin
VARLQKAGLLDSRSEPGVSAPHERLQLVVDELTRRQTRDGGIGYWSADGWTSASLTGYAGAFLLDARDLGASVRPRVVAGITEYMQSALERSPMLPDTTFGNAAERGRAVASRLAARLAALHFLRRAGFPDVVREDELVMYERRMVWQDRVWLAELMAGREDRSAARQLLTRVWRDVEVAGTRVDVPDSLFDTFGFRSHVRPAARLLTATMAINRDHPLLGQLIETVVRQGKATNDWLWNTQDYAAAAEALSQVATWQRSTAPGAEVTVRSARRGASPRVLARGAAGVGVSATVSLEGLVERDGDWVAMPLRVTSDGAPVFYTLTVEEVPLTPPTTPDAKGIIVERWYERFDNGRPVTTVKEGDLVRARLRITVPSDREFVAVADPLPAGLEVVDLSLRTSGTTGPFETEESHAAEAAGDQANQTSQRNYYGIWYGGWWSPWEHHELRDDRVVYFARTLWKGTYTASYVARATTAGTFVRPPAHAVEMYNESLGGRSDGGTFRVVPK